MGSKSARLARFKAAHPTCYFCATAATESEDHVPSRECFRNRVWPEGYVFPACGRCNRAAGQIEQAVALYLMLANHENAEPATDQLRRLVTGVANNNPELLPRYGLSARVARQHYRARKMTLPPGFTYADAPILALPSANREAFELFARRLTCALYYKEVGRPLPLDHFMMTVWTPWADPASHQAAREALKIFPEFRMTDRRNTDIGNQFTYLWGLHTEETIFGFAAQFSKSYFVMGAAVAPSLYEGSPGWTQHSADEEKLEVFLAKPSDYGIERRPR